MTPGACERSLPHRPVERSRTELEQPLDERQQWDVERTGIVPASPLTGQTSWQTSQPKIQSPMARSLRRCERAGMLDRQVADAAAGVDGVRRRRSRRSGSRSGSGCRSRSSCGPARPRGRSAEVSSAPRNTHEPARAWVRRFVFLPIHPRPARAASARSASGPIVDVGDLPGGRPSARRSAASASRRPRSATW